MNLDGIRDLFASERGVFAIFLVLCACGLLYTDRMTIDQWVSYTEWISGTLILGKTVTTAMEIFKRPAAAPTSTVAVTSVTTTNPPPAPSPAPA